MPFTSASVSAHIQRGFSLYKCNQTHRTTHTTCRQTLLLMFPDQICTKPPRQIVKWERKPTRCNSQMFIINTFSTYFGHHYAHLQENKTCVTACGVLRWFCCTWLLAVVGRCVVGCEHCEGYCSTTAINHTQQNQRSTPHAVTHVLFSWRWT